MNKRGQFFLIAALIIVVITIGLSTVYVSLKTQPEDFRVYDLSDEINFESSKVIDVGILEGEESSVITYNNLKDLTTSYAILNPESDFIIYYGNEEGIQARSYENEEGGTVGFNLGGTETTDPLIRRIITDDTLYVDGGIICETAEETTCPPDKTPTVEVLLSEEDEEKEYKYSFNLKKGQNFFIILKKDRGNERIVVSNE